MNAEQARQLANDPPKIGCEDLYALARAAIGKAAKQGDLECSMPCPRHICPGAYIEVIDALKKRGFNVGQKGDQWFDTISWDEREPPFGPPTGAVS